MRLHLALLALTAVVWSACDDTLVPTTPRAAARPVMAVTVSPTALTLAPGEPRQVVARTYDAAGMPLIGRVATWSSGDASVSTVSTAGVVTGVGVGSTTVMATVEGVSATATINVVANAPNILVDASRDGGVWWFPQWEESGRFDPTLDHQGRALAEYLRSLGYRVDELPRPFTITSGVLEDYEIVIRANGFGRYTQQEIAAYREYVEEGGGLLLLSDHMLHAPPDDLARGFGVEFAGITRGDNVLDRYVAHPTTEGVGPLTYGVGSGIVASPPEARVLGRLSSESYLDLDMDGARGPSDPSAPAVLGVMTHGDGRIVFSGDTNLWEWIPRPLVANVLRWLRSE